MADHARGDDRRVSVTTFTLPGDYKWTTVEEALKEAHDQEYELRMQFFWECQRLQAENERLRKAGDGVLNSLDLCYMGKKLHLLPSVIAWNAAKDGKPTE